MDCFDYIMNPQYEGGKFRKLEDDIPPFKSVWHENDTPTATSCVKNRKPGTIPNPYRYSKPPMKKGKAMIAHDVSGN